MPSTEMQDVIAYFRQRRAARANQPPRTLQEMRAAFAPAGELHPLPEDVIVTDVDTGGVPAHWLVAPEANRDRVLLYLHGGGYTLGSVRSHGEPPSYGRTACSSASAQCRTSAHKHSTRAGLRSSSSSRRSFGWRGSEPALHGPSRQSSLVRSSVEFVLT